MKSKCKEVVGLCGSQLLDVRDVAKMLAISSRSVWRLVENDVDFPKPVRIGTKLVRWRKVDIETFISGLSGQEVSHD